MTDQQLKQLFPIGARIRVSNDHARDNTLTTALYGGMSGTIETHTANRVGGIDLGIRFDGSRLTGVTYLNVPSCVDILIRLGPTTAAQ